MKLNVELEITSVRLYGREIPIPHGLSELMNRAGAWELGKPDHSPPEDSFLKNYNRKVVVEDGTFRTYLTCKTSSLKSEEIQRIS